LQRTLSKKLGLGTWPHFDRSQSVHGAQHGRTLSERELDEADKPDFAAAFASLNALETALSFFLDPAALVAAYCFRFSGRQGTNFPWRHG
jgi:hypothetical protein